jgi:hypothetical protein
MGGLPGMLLQEHISVLLEHNIPLGWEKEMEAAGFAPEKEACSRPQEDTDDVESEKADGEEVSFV